MSDNLKKQIAREVLNYFNDRVTPSMAQQLADNILSLPEMEALRMKPIQTMKLREDWPTTFIDKREEWELRRK